MIENIENIENFESRLSIRKKINDTINNSNKTKGYVDDKASLLAITVAASDAPEEMKRTADYVCDGQNDQQEVQEAINNSTANTIILVGGEFIFSDRVIVSANNRKIILNGKVSIIDGNWTSFAIDTHPDFPQKKAPFILTECSHVVFEGGFIDCDNMTHESKKDGAGIMLHKCTHCQVNSVRVENINPLNFNAPVEDGAIIRYQGVLVTKSSNCYVQNCVVRNAGYDAFGARMGWENIFFIRNQASECREGFQAAGYGPAPQEEGFERSGKNVFYSGNTAFDYRTEAFVNHCLTSVYKGNIILNGNDAKSGIAPLSGNNPDGHCIITENLFMDAEFSEGAVTLGTDYAIVANNQFYNVEKKAINTVGQQLQSVTINNNQFFNETGLWTYTEFEATEFIGIELREIRNVNITNNIFQGYHICVLRMSGGGDAAFGCVLSGNTARYHNHFFVEEEDVDGSGLCTISSNSITDRRGTSFFIRNSGQVIVNGNVFSRTGSGVPSTINFYSGQVEAVVSSNAFRLGVTGNHIENFGSSQNIEIVHNIGD